MRFGKEQVGDIVLNALSLLALLGLSLVVGVRLGLVAFLAAVPIMAVLHWTFGPKGSNRFLAAVIVWGLLIFAASVADLVFFAPPDVGIPGASAFVGILFVALGFRSYRYFKHVDANQES